MNDHVARLKNDLSLIEGALGLDVWTLSDVRRGMLGDVFGGAAGLFLALWNWKQGAPILGMGIFLASLAAILILKDFGYRHAGEPSPGTRREVSFFNRYYILGSGVIGGYYIWGTKFGMDLPLLLASLVILSGLWYLFYAISAPSRSISLGGAATLIACGFVLPLAEGMSQILAWIGSAACVGCWFEACLLLSVLRSARK
jgi:hypothetical protein